MNRSRVAGIVCGVAVLAAAADARAQLIVNLSAPGARASAMGGAFIGVADDATTAVTNPAGLSNLSIPEVYGEFKVSDSSCQFCGTGTSAYLSFASIAVPLNSRMTVAAFRHQNISTDNISESLYAGAIGARINDRIRAGIGVGLMHARVQGSGGGTFYGTRVMGGLLFAAADKLTVGASGSFVRQNTIRGGVLDDSKVGGGLAYNLLPRLLLSGDVVRYLDPENVSFPKQTTYGAGGEFVIFTGTDNRVFLRGGGCQCSPVYGDQSGTFGIGYASHQRFQVDFSYVTGLNEVTISGVYRY